MPLGPIYGFNRGTLCSVKTTNNKQTILIKVITKLPFSNTLFKKEDLLIRSLSFNNLYFRGEN